MVALYKDPQGENVFKPVAVSPGMKFVGTSGITTNTTSTGVTEGDSECELIILRERVTQLEETLKLCRTREDEPVH